METLNKFLVSVRPGANSEHDRIVILNPPAHPITKADALLLAAYLVALADDDESFPKQLAAVCNA